MHNNHDENSPHAKLSPSRLISFSDGVMAIIITITVLELKVPGGNTLSALRPLLPLLFTYAVSFQAVGTYWNNHHHLLRTTEHISTGIMWANLNLLFWLSLIPFTTGWLGANHGGRWPTVLYAAVLLACGLAYQVLQQAVVSHSQQRTQLMEELTRHPKGIISLVCYVAAIMFAFFHPVISDILIVLVALVWFIPDRRLEKFI